MGRLPRRSELSLGRRPARARGGSGAVERVDHPAARPVEPRGEDTPGDSDGSVRSGVRVQRHRRGRPRCAGERPGSHPHDLGDASLGQRRQESERHADTRRRLQQLLTRDRIALLGSVRGIPFVRFWSVWNEPNLQLFLTPQFDARGRSVAPANYAKLAAAAYTGLKAGNPLAQVGIGETSARGSDKANGLRPTHSPGKFAELVAKANPRLKFDAWTHHPYPFNPNFAPSQVVKWPNVTLASLPRFDDSLKRLVQAQVGADLDHGVRPPDAPRGLARRALRDPGGVHPAVDLDGRRLSVREHVHLVRLPGRPGPAMGVGHLHTQRHAQGNLPRAVLGERTAARPAQRARARPQRHAHAAR